MPRGVCVSCGRTEKLKTCGHCHEEQYCSIECQKLWWPSHSKRCRSQKESSPFLPYIVGQYQRVLENDSLQGIFRGISLVLDRFGFFELTHHIRAKDVNQDRTVRGSVVISASNSTPLPANCTIDALPAVYASLEIELVSDQRMRARIELAPQTLIGRVTITIVGTETESVEGQAEHAAALYERPFVPVEFHAQVVEQLGETLRYANVIDVKPLFDKITASVLAMSNNKLSALIVLADVWATKLEKFPEYSNKFAETLDTLISSICSELGGASDSNIELLKEKLPEWMACAGTRSQFVPSHENLKKLLASPRSAQPVAAAPQLQPQAQLQQAQVNLQHSQHSQHTPLQLHAPVQHAVQPGAQTNKFAAMRQ